MSKIAKHFHVIRKTLEGALSWVDVSIGIEHCGDEIRVLKIRRMPDGIRVLEAMTMDRESTDFRRFLGELQDETLPITIAMPTGLFWMRTSERNDDALEALLDEQADSAIINRYCLLGEESGAKNVLLASIKSDQLKQYIACFGELQNVRIIPRLFCLDNLGMQYASIEDRVARDADGESIYVLHYERGKLTAFRHLDYEEAHWASLQQELPEDILDNISTEYQVALGAALTPLLARQHQFDFANADQQASSFIWTYRQLATTAALLAGSLVLILAAGLYGYKAMLEHEYEALQIKRIALLPELALRDSLKSDEQRQQFIWQQISAAAADQTNCAGIVLDIAAALPKTVWLEEISIEITEEAGWQTTIQGFGKTEEDVASFLGKLETLPAVKSAMLRDLRHEKQDKRFRQVRRAAVNKEFTMVLYAE